MFLLLFVLYHPIPSQLSKTTTKVKKKTKERKSSHVTNKTKWKISEPSKRKGLLDTLFSAAAATPLQYFSSSSSFFFFFYVSWVYHRGTRETPSTPGRRRKWFWFMRIEALILMHPCCVQNKCSAARNAPLVPGRDVDGMGVSS